MTYGYNPEIILAGRRMNDGMGEYVADQVIKHMLKKGIPVLHSNILMLGFTFKENCPDVRNTKVIDIVRTLREYNVNVIREGLPFRYVRWVVETPKPVEKLRLTSTTAVGVDRVGRSVLMFENEWSIRLACENNEGLVLAETADRMVADDMEI